MGGKILNGWEFCNGENTYRKYFLPTIEYECIGNREYICIVLWKYYIGFTKYIR